MALVGPTKIRSLDHLCRPFGPRTRPNHSRRSLTTLDAKLAEQANNPYQPPRDHVRSYANPLRSAQTAMDPVRHPADRDSASRQRCHRRFDRCAGPRSFDPPIIDQSAAVRACSPLS
jgi:hypothetical protein